MVIVVNILLLIAMLLTVATVPAVLSLRHLQGDSAVGVILYFLLLTPRWVCIAIALALASKRRAFGFISPSTGRQLASVIGFHTLAGVVSIAAVVMGTGPHSDAFKPWALVLSVLLPAIVIVATFFALARTTSGGALAVLPWRLGATAVLAVVGAGGTTIWWTDRADRLESRAYQAASEAKHAHWMHTQLDKLNALPPDAPLAAYFPWLGLSIDELRDPALARVRARPHLNDDLAAMLRSDHAVDALQFMWLWMPDTPAELAQPVRDAIATLPAWTQRTLDASPATSQDASSSTAASNEEWDETTPFPPPEPVDLWSLSQATVVLATRYQDSGLDFRTPIQQMMDVLQARKLPDDEFASDPTYQARAYLETWLKR